MDNSSSNLDKLRDYLWDRIASGNTSKFYIPLDHWLLVREELIARTGNPAPLTADIPYPNFLLAGIPVYTEFNDL